MDEIKKRAAIAKQVEKHLRDDDVEDTLTDLYQSLGRAEEALKQCDLKAEAGMCQFSSGGKHEFLKDVRRVVGDYGIQGGVTKFGK